MIINKKKRNIIISVILAIILLIASIYGLLYYLAERHRENSQEVLAEVTLDINHFQIKTLIMKYQKILTTQ